MGVSRLIKQSFTVIGIEGSTNDGSDFIERLWNDANARFVEIVDLCKRDESGGFVGFWGAMSDFSRSFRSWEGFSQGLYLAGAECEDNAESPNGWTKWVVPAFEYLCFDCAEFEFGQAIDYVRRGGFSVVGAAQDFTAPRTGKGYMYIPIRKFEQ